MPTTSNNTVEDHQIDASPQRNRRRQRASTTARAQSMAREAADQYFASMAADIPGDDAPGDVSLLGTADEIADVLLPEIAESAFRESPADHRAHAALAAVAETDEAVAYGVGSCPGLVSVAEGLQSRRGTCRRLRRRQRRSCITRRRSRHRSTMAKLAARRFRRAASLRRSSVHPPHRVAASLWPAIR